MSQNPNALERLMNRSKPKVPPRPDVVSEVSSLDIKTQRLNDENKPKFQADSEQIEPTPKITSSSFDIKTSLSQDNYTTKDVKEEFKTVRNTTRLEVGVNEALTNLCNQQKITKETWFEAAYLYFSERPEAMKEVIELASCRLEQRKQIANIRRAEAMQKKFLR